VSVSAGTDDLRALSDAELNVRLTRLEWEERLVSKRRTTLHARIDFVRAGGFASTDPAHEQLSSLEGAEAELSSQRHALHLQIDELVAERSRRHLRY
jgi:RsiG-like